jgi:hypothetical protein
MEFDEITISSPDFLGGQTFRPVTLEHAWEGPVDLNEALPVIMMRRSRRFLGVRWYPEVYRTRGVFNVTGNRIILRPTAPVVIERTGWWRRLGYWLVTCWRPRAHARREGSFPQRHA